MKFSYFGIALLISSLVQANPVATRAYVDTVHPSNDTGYSAQAEDLNAYLIVHENMPTDRDMLVAMLKAIDYNMPLYFPRGPFHRNDFIAMAWLESGFNQMEDGTHGERGLFQIMPDEFAAYGVTKYFYGVKTNTRMAFRVLHEKYGKWHDYKRAIIAYNGVVVLKGGRWSERYWRAFKKRKDKIDLILPVLPEGK